MGRLFNPDIRQIENIHYQQRWKRDLIGYSTPLVYKIATGAGAAVTPTAQSYLLTTGAAGANKGIEFFEYLKESIFFRNSPGENSSLFNKYNYVEGQFGEDFMTIGTQEGLSFYGIEMGSFINVAPVSWNDPPATLLSRIQFRRNLERLDYEISVYCNLGTGNSPITELCNLNNGEYGLMSIIYNPKKYIDFYVNNIKIHSFKNKQILDALFTNAAGDNGGFGAFATSGSNALGQVAISLNSFNGFTDLY